MITSALIRPSFLADTLRHSVLEVTVARPVPHRVARLVPSGPRSILPPPLQPFSQITATSRGIQVSTLPYIRPMAVKYPHTNSPEQAHAPGWCD